MNMTEDTNAALKILEQAMDIEQEGRQFYMKAAQTTQDKKGREIFITLADDEKKHHNLIERQHKALTSEGNWVSSPEIKPTEIDINKSLFPEGQEALEKVVKIESNDWDALMFGLHIEMKSYELYRKSALRIEDPLGKQMFEFLAGQEQSHWDTLMMRYDALFGPVSWQY